jgi:hypothetical protein
MQSEISDNDFLALIALDDCLKKIWDGYRHLHEHPQPGLIVSIPYIYSFWLNIPQKNEVWDLLRRRSNPIRNVLGGNYLTFAGKTLDAHQVLTVPCLFRVPESILEPSRVAGARAAVEEMADGDLHHGLADAGEAAAEASQARKGKWARYPDLEVKYRRRQEYKVCYI